MITFLLLVSALCFQFTVLLSKFRELFAQIEEAKKEMMEKVNEELAEIEVRIHEKMDNMNMTIQIINEQYNGGNTVVKEGGHLDTAYNGCTMQQAGQRKDRFADAEEAEYEEVKDEPESEDDEPLPKKDDPVPVVETARKGCPKMPACIATAESMAYWRKLRKAGFVDENFKLLSCSRQQAMYIALLMAEKIRLRKKWKPFEDFWGIRKLAQEKCKMVQTGILPPRAKEIIEIFN